MGTTALFVATLVGATAPYVRSHAATDASSHCLWWPTSTISWQQNRDTSGSGATGPNALDAVTASFATWQAVMQRCGSATLEEGPRSSLRTVGYDAHGNNANVVLFRGSSCGAIVSANDACWQQGTCANTHDCWEHSSSILGITTVSFEFATGRVLDADIELNAANYVFTTANGPPCSSAQGPPCVATDVQNTVTHEIGHLLGLSHAEEAASTMSATAAIGEIQKRVLDTGTASFVCEVYTKDLAPKDCVIQASTDVLGPSADAKLGCTSTSAGSAFLSLLAIAARLRRLRAATALVVALFGLSAEATTVLALDVEGLTRSSDTVIHATVARVETRWTEDHTHIVTEVHLEVLAPIKGETGTSVIVVQPGGVVGRIGQRVEGVAAFETGEEVVVFLEARGPRFTVTGLSQGKFHVDRGTRNHAPVARQSKGEALFVDGITSQPVSAPPLAISLDTLRAQVGAAVAEEARAAGAVAPLRP